MADDKLYHRRPICKTCNVRGVRHETYDSVYCECCNTWLEEKCSDDGCEFCKNRPDRPMPIINYYVPVRGKGGIR